MRMGLLMAAAFALSLTACTSAPTPTPVPTSTPTPTATSTPTPTPTATATPTPTPTPTATPTPTPDPTPTPTSTTTPTVRCGDSNRTPHYGVLLAEPDSEEVIQENRTYRVRLYEGWNLIGLPGEPVNSAIDDILGDTPVEFVLSNDGGAEDGDSPPAFFSGLYWRQVVRFNGKWVGDITDIHGGNGYWVYSSGDATLEVLLSADKPRPAHVIGWGWNLLAMWDPQRRPQGVTVDNESVDIRLTGDYQTLNYRVAYSYHPETSSWKKIVPKSDEDFEAGYGYWLWIAGPSVLCP